MTKHFIQKLEKKKNADQDIHSLKSKQSTKVLKYQQDKLTEVKTFYEQLSGQKNVQKRIQALH